MGEHLFNSFNSNITLVSFIFFTIQFTRFTIQSYLMEVKHGNMTRGQCFVARCDDLHLIFINLNHHTYILRTLMRSNIHSVPVPLFVSHVIFYPSSCEDICKICFYCDQVIKQTKGLNNQSSIYISEHRYCSEM